MGASCCHASQLDPHRADARYRRVLWAVLAINLAMFFAELTLGAAAGSVSLHADSLDFLGDAANYGISLFVAGLAGSHRARAALLKGISMGLFGVWVITAALWHLARGTVPEPLTMGVVGLAALLANALSFALLWNWRAGDSNMQSAWLCSRNDVLGNCAVLLAACGVFGTSNGWPDVMVAAIMATLGLQGACVVVRAAYRELHGGGA